MNKHLSKYLTHKNPLLREWIKARISRTDQVYDVYEGDILFIPKENLFIEGTVEIGKEVSIQQKVIYCHKLVAYNSYLTSLPNHLPVTETLDCTNNRLEELPSLPNCKFLYCGNNKLTKLPDLPNCEDLRCSSNSIKELPKLPNCKILYCNNNQIRILSNIPSCCEILHCSYNYLKVIPKALKTKIYYLPQSIA